VVARIAMPRSRTIAASDSEPSNTTHGMKALVLKVLDPFFKRKHAGYIMPVMITGTYEHPMFGLDLSDRNDKGPR